MAGRGFPAFQVPTVSISNVRTDVQSISLQPYRLRIEENGRSRQFEFLPQRDSIVILLYHREKHLFLVMRKFRPAVFVSRVRQLPLNRGKTVEEIDWNSEDKSLGCTLELCSGYVEDRTKHLDDSALAIIEDELGLRVGRQYLQHIQTFLTGVTDSGAPCHFYYAELDHAEIVGDGKVAKRDKVWMKMEDARNMLKLERDPFMPAVHYHALDYWFIFKEKYSGLETMEETPWFGVERRSAIRDQIWFDMAKKAGLLRGEWRLGKMEEKRRHTVMRMDYQVMGINHTQDFVIRPDTVSILIKDVDSMKLVMMRRFRPAALVGRVMARPENEGKLLEDIDFSAYPNSWAFTCELASGRIRGGEDAEAAAVRVASSKLGYIVPKRRLKLVAKLLIGSSAGGESKYVYYAQCRETHQMKNWKGIGRKGNARVFLLRYAGHIHPISTPSSAYVALDWMSMNERRQKLSMTQEQLRAVDATRRRQVAEFEMEMERIWVEVDQKEAEAAAVARELEERRKMDEVEEEGAIEEEEIEAGDGVAEENDENGQGKRPATGCTLL